MAHSKGPYYNYETGVVLALFGVQPCVKKCTILVGSKYCHNYCSDSLPGHQQPLSDLRDSSNFVKYVVTAALGKIHKVTFHLNTVYVI